VDEERRRKTPRRRPTAASASEGLQGILGETSSVLLRSVTAFENREASATRVEAGLCMNDQDYLWAMTMYNQLKSVPESIHKAIFRNSISQQVFNFWSNSVQATPAHRTADVYATSQTMYTAAPQTMYAAGPQAYLHYQQGPVLHSAAQPFLPPTQYYSDPSTHAAFQMSSSQPMNPSQTMDPSQIVVTDIRSTDAAL